VVFSPVRFRGTLVCTGFEQGRRPRAYGSGRLVDSGNAIQPGRKESRPGGKSFGSCLLEREPSFEGRNPDRWVGASVLAYWKGSHPSRKESRPVGRSFGSCLLERKPSLQRKESRPVGRSFGSCLLERKPSFTWQHHHVGVEAATLPMNLVLPSWRRAHPLGEGGGIVTGAWG
jgi:hypothetical protein